MGKNGKVDKKVVTSIRIDSSLKKQLTIMAKKNRRSTNNLIGYILNLYLESARFNR